ncbi:MAG: RNA 2',3'-cyclic phosphodiesterase [Burkholderiales bacterium]
MRLFFALRPPEETARALHAWATTAQQDTGGRVTRAETIHLTLAFLGELPAARAAAATAAASRVSAAAHAMLLEETGYWRHNKIVWAAPRELPAALGALAARLGEELGKESFALERRAFAAHVTLIRKARAAEKLPEFRAVEWPLREFLLVRSVLSPQGSSYETLERFALT